LLQTLSTFGVGDWLAAQKIQLWDNKLKKKKRGTFCISEEVKVIIPKWLKSQRLGLITGWASK